MQIAQILQRLGIVFLILLSSVMFACKNYNGSVTGANVYRVKHLPYSKTINVSDSSLSDWEDSFIVLEIAPQNASKYQWKDIRGKKPDELIEGDFGIKVYMARDKSYWYIALDAMDDKTLPSKLPYSGDCLEIFFAGKHLGSPVGMHTLVTARGSQAAFFQLELPAAALDEDNKLDHFPEYRTGKAFRDSNSILSEFVASAWTTNTGWRAEARIPLDALDPDVRSQLNGHQPLKMNIDYLDYDVRTAPNTAAANLGFEPDNVFCLDSEEKHVNVPKHMRSVIFE